MGKITNITLNSNLNVATSIGEGFSTASNQFFTTLENTSYAKPSVGSVVNLSDNLYYISAVSANCNNTRRYAGTATQSATTLTIVTNTGDNLIVGSVITFNSVVMYVSAILSGSGGAGSTYTVSVSQTVGTATAYTGNTSLGIYTVASTTAVGSVSAPHPYTSNPPVVSDRTYYVDWSTILDNNKKYKLHFTFISAGNTLFDTGKIKETKIAQIFADLPTVNNYQNIFNSNYALNTTCLGFVMMTIIAPAANASAYLQALDNTNLPVYMYGRPYNNTFRIRLLDNSPNQNLFVDNVAFTGTATQSGTTLTVATITAGGNNLTIGTKFTLSGLVMYITAFGTGTGGLGTYTVTGSQTVGTATSFTALGSALSPYILTLSFTEIDEKENDYM